MTTGDNNSTPNSFFEMVTGSGEARQSENEPAKRFDKSSVKSPKIGEVAEVSSAASDGPDIEGSTSDSHSDMPHDARRVLVHLMRQGVIIAAQKPKLFELVNRYEAQLRRHLSEVYLQLSVDARAGVVFVASSSGDQAHADETNAADESIEGSLSLITKRTLPLYDTLLLLVLRKHYQDRESAGEQKITIDIERLESRLTPFLPLTDHASLDRRKLIARVKEMARRKVLSTIRGSEDRYEITPVIRYVVNAEFLESMLAEYQRLALEAAGDTSANTRADTTGRAASTAAHDDMKDLS